MPDPYIHSRRRGKLMLSEPGMAAALALPPGVRISHARTVADPLRTEIYIEPTGPDEAPWIPEQPADVETQIIGHLNVIGVNDMRTLAVRWHVDDAPTDPSAAYADTLAAVLRRAEAAERDLEVTGPEVTRLRSWYQTEHKKRHEAELQAHQYLGALQRATANIDELRKELDEAHRTLGEQVGIQADERDLRIRAQQVRDDAIRDQRRIRDAMDSMAEGLDAVRSENDDLSARLDAAHREIESLRTELTHHDVDPAQIAFGGRSEIVGGEELDRGAYGLAPRVADAPDGEALIRQRGFRPPGGTVLRESTSGEVYVGTTDPHSNTDGMAYVPTIEDIGDGVLAEAAGVDPIRAAQVTAQRAVDDLVDTVRRELRTRS